MKESIQTQGDEEERCAYTSAFTEEETTTTNNQP
jgi:hypothetical protein